MPDIKDMNVPLVNQPGKVLLWYPTAIVACQCQGNKITLLVLTGFQNWVRCGHCGKLYSISKEGLTMDNLSVDISVPPPQSSVM